MKNSLEGFNEGFEPAETISELEDRLGNYIV